jgi:hypothetical protein
MNQFVYAMLTTTALAWGMSAHAQAMSCADEIRKVDAALAKATQLAAPRVAEVRGLRNEASKLQAEGKNAECLATIERAKAILGVQ